MQEKNKVRAAAPVFGGGTVFEGVFSSPWKTWPGMAPNVAGKIFFWPIQTLPTFWAEQFLMLSFFLFEIFWIPNFWISRFPDFQTPPPPTPPPTDEPSDPNLTPLPTHPGIKYVARSLAAI